MSKIFKLTLATMFALAFVVSTASASTATFTSNLMVGSSGESVRGLQMFLNSCSDTALAVTAGANGSAGFESTYFGMATKAAVQKYQTKVGVPSTGYFGNMSRNAASTTGNVCGGGAGVTVSGCTPGAMFSSTTGASCTTVTSTVAGCSAGALFSSTTGASCSTGTTTTVTGGAGDIQDVELLSSISNEKVGEGDMDHKVFAFTVEADNGSDLAINSFKLNLTQSDNGGSKKLNRYASKVSVWMGSTKVGSADVSSFSESSNVYSRSISLSNAIVRADKTETFYVSVDANATIDSVDLNNNDWTVTLESTRFSDGTGAILTDTDSINRSFEFASLASANDIEFKVNLATSNMAAKTVKVSTTSNTLQVELLRFTLKAQGSNMMIDQIPVNLATNETDIDEVTSNVTLKIAGNTYNETVTTSSASASVAVLFDDLNLSVSKDATVEGVIYADLNDIEPSVFDEGTTLAAAITSTYVGALAGNYFDVEDINGDQIEASDRTGSAMGEVMTFRSTGVNTVMGTPTYSQTTDTNGLITSATYTIPVAVTSFGNTLYMGQSAQLNTSVTASNAFNVVFEDSNAPSTEVVSGSTSITLSTSNATIETNGFRLDDGVTKNFTITVNMATPPANNSSFRARLDQIKTFTEAALNTGTASDLLPVTNYRTDYKYINN